MGKSIIIGITNTKGGEPRKVYHPKTSILTRTVFDCIETSGETRRDQDRGRIRDAFMAENGLDRVMFEKKCAGGAGYREWRKFAAEHGLNLPA